MIQVPFRIVTVSQMISLILTLASNPLLVISFLFLKHRLNYAISCLKMICSSLAYKRHLDPLAWFAVWHPLLFAFNLLFLLCHLPFPPHTPSVLNYFPFSIPTTFFEFFPASVHITVSSTSDAIPVHRWLAIFSLRTSSNATCSLNEPSYLLSRLFYSTTILFSCS